MAQTVKDIFCKPRRVIIRAHAQNHAPRLLIGKTLVLSVHGKGK